MKAGAPSPRQPRPRAQGTRAGRARGLCAFAFGGAPLLDRRVVAAKNAFAPQPFFSPLFRPHGGPKNGFSRAGKVDFTHDVPPTRENFSQIFPQDSLRRMETLAAPAGTVVFFSLPLLYFPFSDRCLRTVSGTL